MLRLVEVALLIQDMLPVGEGVRCLCLKFGRQKEKSMRVFVTEIKIFLSDIVKICLITILYKHSLISVTEDTIIPCILGKSYNF